LGTLSLKKTCSGIYMGRWYSWAPGTFTQHLVGDPPLGVVCCVLDIHYWTFERRVYAGDRGSCKRKLYLSSHCDARWASPKQNH